MVPELSTVNSVGRDALAPSTTNRSIETTTVLRLRLAPSLPWVDSQSRVRSPLESLVLLGGEARRAIIDDPSAYGLVAWEIGVLTDDWDAPSHSKPVQMGADDGGSAIGTAFAVGSERAQEIAADLMPLWKRVLRVLSPRDGFRFLISDAVWDETARKWTDIHDGLARGLVDGVARPTDLSAVEGWSWLRGGLIEFCDLTRQWWPSAAGGLVAVDTPVPLRDSEMIVEADLRRLAGYCMTSKAYDNLGFNILSRSPSWDALQAALSSHGLVDGMAVDAVTGESV